MHIASSQFPSFHAIFTLFPKIFTTTDQRCIWCDSAEHDQRDCDEHKEALRRDLIYYEIRSTAEGVREATGWECPLDKNSVYALSQLHEVYVDEKRWRTEDTPRPSKIPESWNSGGKGKEKTIQAFKLASDIEQQTDLTKVFEERILDSREIFRFRNYSE